MPTPSRKKQRFSAAPAAPKVRPRVLLLSAMSLLSAPLHLACGSPPATEAPPKPALAASKGAQREFRSLSSRWHVADPAQRNRLETEFRSFLSRYPNDDQTRLASAYLAWILMQKGELVEARQLIERTKRGPQGTARDFSQVVEAALLVEHEQPLEAIRILRPMQGKIIDPVERFLATEQLVIAALAANLHSEALTYMVDWIEEAKLTDRPAIKEAISSHLRRIPRKHLERALVTLEPDPDDPDREHDAERYGHKQWLFEAISLRLAAVAVREQDSQLAKAVVDKNPSLAMNADASELLRLATGDEPPATIAGRTIGLLLTTTDVDARRRSSEVASGISEVLGFVGDTEGGLQLVFEEDTGDSTQALSELSARGAALLVGGVTVHSAELAARYAERTGAPVLVLSPTLTTGPYVFSVGVSPAEEQSVLREALGYPAEETLVQIPLGAEACRQALMRDGFPVGQWMTGGIQALLLMAEPGCVRALAEQTRAAGFRPTFALGLEAAAAYPALLDQDLLLVSSGSFPLNLPGQTPKGWFRALGNDVATIAIDVLSSLPEVRLDDAGQVSTYHADVRAALSGFTSDALSTTTATDFGARGQLRRQLSARRVSADPTAPVPKSMARPR